MKPTPQGSTRFLVRLAPELTTKSRRTRRRFQNRLVANIKDALAPLGANVSAMPFTPERILRALNKCP